MTQGMRSPARVLGEWRAAIARLDALPAGAPGADEAQRLVESLRLEYHRASLAWLDAEEEAAAASAISARTGRFDLERLAQDARASIAPDQAGDVARRRAIPEWEERAGRRRVERRHTVEVRMVARPLGGGVRILAPR